VDARDQRSAHTIPIRNPKSAFRNKDIPAKDSNRDSIQAPPRLRL
jgi:hypothetical protein